MIDHDAIEPRVRLNRACKEPGPCPDLEEAYLDLYDEVKRLRAERDDAISTLDAWFDRRKLGHDAVDQAVLDCAKGYLRTCRVGGMPQEASDAVLAVIGDMARLAVFADLFIRLDRERLEKAEAVRIAEWNKRRDAESSLVLEKAICLTAEAERDALRTALHGLVSTLWMDGPGASDIVSSDALEAARAALKGDTK